MKIEIGIEHTLSVLESVPRRRALINFSMEKTLDSVRRIAVREARRLVPKKTGKLAKSIKSKLRKRGVASRVVFTADAKTKGKGRWGATEYARFVEEGTRPHLIEAWNSYYLRFTDKSGKVRYAQKVHHPGTKPQPFLEPGVGFAMSRAPDILWDVYERELDRQSQRVRIPRIGFD